MKFSRYMLKIDGFPRADYVCLFSTKSSTVIALRKTAYEDVRDGKFEMLDKIHSAKLRQHFLVDDFEQETAQVLDGIKRQVGKSSTFNLTVITTTECNFACKYCAVEGLKSDEYMSKDTADDILDMLEKRCLDGEGIKRLNLYYYGGEPLLNKSVIDYLNPRIRAICDRFSVKPTLNITTNGVHFEAAYARNLLNYFPAIYALISIDGPIDVQNHRRPSIDGRCSYAPVFKNVAELSGLINVTLKVNLDRENAATFHPVLDNLLAAGLKDRIRVLIEPVTNTHNPTAHCLQNTFADLDDYRLLVEAWRKQVGKGFELSDINIVEGSTCGNSMNSITCNPDGSMYSCTGMCRISELELANVHNRPTIDSIENKMRGHIRATFKECLACPYLPMCNGGCRTQAYLKNGNINSRLCRRPQYDYVYPEYLKLKYHNHEKRLNEVPQA